MGTCGSIGLHTRLVIFACDQKRRSLFAEDVENAAEAVARKLPGI